MVEAGYIGPRLRTVASLASEWHSVRPFPLHTIFELAVMGIGMASSAAGICKMKRQNLAFRISFSGSVAVGARNGRMRPGKRKLRVTVHRNRIERAVKIGNRMALLAGIVIGRRGELIVVNVFVAIGAAGKLDFVYRFFSCGDVAF